MANDTVHMIVHVSVATVWTSPESPEELDVPAISSPVDLRKWLTMSIEDRLALHDKDKDQTQLLFGSVVQVVEQTEDWAKIVVPNQPSIKDERGYPGWVPLCQLSPYDPEQGVTAPNAVVTEPITYLHLEDGTSAMEISYLTHLPVVNESPEWVEVQTPLGLGKVKHTDVTIHEKAIPHGDGAAIVREGERFLGLPYLWGGTSAFGYDCSGFAYSMHRANGIIVPRDASNQARAGKLVEPEDLLPGDLVFFAFEEGKGRVHHVGIYYGDGQMIHAPNTGKTVEIITIKDSKYEVEHCISRRYW